MHRHCPLCGAELDTHVVVRDGLDAPLGRARTQEMPKKRRKPDYKPRQSIYTRHRNKELSDDLQL